MSTFRQVPLRPWARVSPGVVCGLGGAGFLPLARGKAAPTGSSACREGADGAHRLAETEAAVPLRLLHPRRGRTPSPGGAPGTPSLRSPPSSNSDVWSARLQEAPGGSGHTCGPPALGAARALPRGPLPATPAEQLGVRGPAPPSGGAGGGPGSRSPQPAPAPALRQRHYRPPGQRVRRL